MNENVKLLCNGVDIPVDFSTAPNGERCINLEFAHNSNYTYTIKLLSADSKSIMDCLLLADKLSNIAIDTGIYITLETYYMPYSIQNKECKERKFSSTILMLEIFYSVFNKITTTDMCNAEDLSSSLDYFPFQNNLLEYNTESYILVSSNNIEYIGGIHNVVDNYEASYIIAPNKNAVTRATKAMNDLNATGLITFDGTDVMPEDTSKLIGATNLIVVDNNYEDRFALVSLAKVIKKYNKTVRLTLIVTHIVCIEGISELGEYYIVVCVDNEYNRKILTNKI